MFLDELNGKVSLTPNPKQMRKLGMKPDDIRVKTKRLIASPDTIGGEVFISAFITLANESAAAEVEALGVQLRARFDGGLYTALIPVYKIEALAALDGVVNIEVATVMEPTTVTAREKTNVDDVLTYSASARASGLPNAYDGSGVLLGITDTGIDFQHIAFKDKDGNYRMKRAYVYDGSTSQEYTSFGSLTTDNEDGDHSTHTCSTAGGSSVIFSGSNVTVTDDHSQASAGGMAPAADLYLAGLASLNNTYLVEAMQKICAYADANNMPVVVSNSWGSHMGPHDGTGSMATSVAQLFGDNHPNHICLFAASNDSGRGTDDEPGGFFVSGANASSTNPVRTVVCSPLSSNWSSGVLYSGVIAYAVGRTPTNTRLNCKVRVIDISNGSVAYTATVTQSGTVNLSTYYPSSYGTLTAYTSTSTSGKPMMYLVASSLQSAGLTSSTVNGVTHYSSNYILAVEFYPATGSNNVDVWAAGSTYFSDVPAVSGYAWQRGTDDMTASDQSTITDIISIGA